MSPKSIVLALYAVGAFLSGAIDQYFYPGVEYPPSALGAMFVFAMLMFAWYRLDSEQRGYRRSVGLNIAVFGIGVIALPYYFFRSRGAKWGLLATGILLLAVFACGWLVLAGANAVYYGLQV